MEIIRDILVNLLSNAIWAVGGFLLARLLFLKKSVLFRFWEQPFKKPCDVAYNDMPQKKSTLFVYSEQFSIFKHFFFSKRFFCYDLEKADLSKNLDLQSKKIDGCDLLFKKPKSN